MFGGENGHLKSPISLTVIFCFSFLMFREQPTIYIENRLKMGKYLHRYLNQSDFEADYNDETTPKYIEPWVSATNDDDELRVDYNKRRIIFELDTEVTVSDNRRRR